MALALQIENLSKEYRLGVIGHGTLYRDLQSWWARWRGKPDPNRPIQFGASGGNVMADHLWALRDVSLAVQQGEVLGVVGKNGAGKSTLLKILSRVTAPSSGEVRLKGRVASLLEVGTGFHGELTGRENIFLNGAILGMTMSEIRRKFDEIVAFSGIEDFIDTPVKRYSSGMYVRLAFAVAAHLEAEILVVDEVLAVGDAEFQKKCLGKMGNVAHEGRTVLFVSHNLQTIRTLCPRVVLLDQGRLVADGPAEQTLQYYWDLLRAIKIDADSEVDNPDCRRGSGGVRFTSIALLDGTGRECYDFTMGDNIFFRFNYQVFKEMAGLRLSILVRSGVTGEFVTSVRHVVTTETLKPGAAGTLMVEFPSVFIRPGEYPLYFHLADLRPKPANYDVVDGMTAPLVIWPGENPPEANFDQSRPQGYFSIPSRLYSENN
jgi:lipopolysaccharide transport system ATP-binding protein